MKRRIVEMVASVDISPVSNELADDFIRSGTFGSSVMQRRSGFVIGDILTSTSF